MEKINSCEKRNPFSLEDGQDSKDPKQSTADMTVFKSFNKNLSQKDLQLIASSVVLAALSVAPYDNMRGASHLELEHEKEQNLRMANLIGFIIDPKLESREVLSRSSLLTELLFTLSFADAIHRIVVAMKLTFGCFILIHIWKAF
ncbi:Eukaryotic translation initiation factor 3 subunit A [Camellia lanceoleosa]|uniref:Eukaryotic translation initiation factor 3 subunit A n=1 Tax=Camellia lanceoleosa TaxID=1840588 RepID=A0ACC0F119_9ERIC|nr:Eukaryotic translation initiation factor 3 subunit A [Camellia lanceoleosa]